MMQPEPALLTHPFYEAWERGDVTPGQLAAYGAAYQDFMDRVPEYWTRVLAGLGITDPRGAAIVTEEREHAGLWTAWQRVLPSAEEPPALDGLFAGLAGLEPAELAGALHAYEIQQPAVAETKKHGLVTHYGVPEADLGFFDAHIEDEDEHIAFGAEVREQYADHDAFDRGFRAGATLVYESLDAFRSGDQAARAAG